MYSEEPLFLETILVSKNVQNDLQKGPKRLDRNCRKRLRKLFDAIKLGCSSQRRPQEPSSALFWPHMELIRSNFQFLQFVLPAFRRHISLATFTPKFVWRGSMLHTSKAYIGAQLYHHRSPFSILNSRDLRIQSCTNKNQQHTYTYGQTMHNELLITSWSNQTTPEPGILSACKCAYCCCPFCVTRAYKCVQNSNL